MIKSNYHSYMIVYYIIENRDDGCFQNRHEIEIKSKSGKFQNGPKVKKT